MVIVAKGLKEQVAPGLTPRSVTRLRQLAKRMRRVKAEKFNMDYWFLRRRKPNGRGWCGTAACLAGHTVLLMGRKPVFGRGGDIGNECKNGHQLEVSVAAKRWLGLSDTQAGVLFHRDRWPRMNGLMSPYKFDHTSAKSAADRIEFFIREGR